MALIFFTGAVVLALEVLASRIMTPYFGVSLYIWAGILSITLAFLAAGYYLGGLLCQKLNPARLAWLFLLLPVTAAASVLAACVVYPLWFPVLAQANLIVGSFVASAVLLSLPLVGLSAMNPLLIALRKADARAGDSGAGRVFFVSTAGSVLGVVVTAFWIIPTLTNFAALLWLALALVTVCAAFGLRAQLLSATDRRRLLIAAAAVAALAGAFIAGEDRYMAMLSARGDGPYRFQVMAEYTSVFGNVKVVDMRSRDTRDLPVKAYLQDGIIQNRTTLDGVSVSMYTYVLDRLVGYFAPRASAALVLGLGAGIVPEDLRRRGVRTTVVEINPDGLKAATEHFGFKAEHFDVRIEDARTFVRRCSPAYDVVVVDLFQGDAVPDYLMTAEFFRAIRGCLRGNGAVVMNAFFDDADDAPNRRLMATVATAFGTVVRFDVRQANGFVVGTNGLMPGPMELSPAGIPPSLVNLVLRTLASGTVVGPSHLAGQPPLTDRHNVASLLFAESYLKRRRAIVEVLSPRVLVN
jgi:predicted membrane-bound spermidine synthase